MGPDAASRYPVGPAVKLQIPGEPPEADFSTTEVRHSIVNSLATIETAVEDMNKAFIKGVESSMDAMTDLHDCCTTSTHNACSTSTNNVVSWEKIKMATAEDTEMQDLMKYIMSGFPEDARMLPAHVKPYNTYKSALYIVDNVIMFRRQGGRAPCPSPASPPPPPCSTPRGGPHEGQVC